MTVNNTQKTIQPFAEEQEQTSPTAEANNPNGQGLDSQGRQRPFPQQASMTNAEVIQEKWKQLVGPAKNRWYKLTE